MSQINRESIVTREVLIEKSPFLIEILKETYLNKKIHYARNVSISDYFMKDLQKIANIHGISNTYNHKRYYVIMALRININNEKVWDYLGLVLKSDCKRLY
jgi:hypothetical protein